jgi:hypothetical protein
MIIFYDKILHFSLSLVNVWTVHFSGSCRYFVNSILLKISCRKNLVDYCNSELDDMARPHGKYFLYYEIKKLLIMILMI